MTPLVGELLERAARALPARYEEHRHGWCLRHSDSSMWWAGAAFGHGTAAAAALDERIDEAERFYLARRAVPRFQVCPACPAGLDAALSTRGYRQGPSVALLTAETSAVVDTPQTSPLSTRLTDELEPAWFDTWRAVHAPGHDPAPELRLLRCVDPPTGYALVHSDGHVVAVGRGVADRGWTGVFGLATLPAARGLGAARATLSALAGWAQAQDASHLYTQVMHENTAALGLFEAAGFTELATYHYRTGTA